MFYYIIFFFLILLSVTDIAKYPAHFKMVLLYFICVAMVVIAGSRFETGFDFFNYQIIYSDITHFSDVFSSMAVEPGFGLLIYSIKTLTGSYQFLLFLIALLAVTLKFRFIQLYSIYPFLSVLIYFSRVYLAQDMGQMRQGLAMAIILFTLPALEQRNFRKFLFIVAAAACLHFSAIFFFPIYFIGHKKFSARFIIISIVIAIFCAVFVNFKTLLLTYGMAILPAFVANKLFLYTAVFEAEQTIGLTFSIFFRIFIVLLFLYLQIKTNAVQEHSNVVLNIYVIGLIFYLTLNSFPQLSGRGSLYFQQFEILLIPMAINYFKEYLFKVIVILLLGFYCVWGINAIIFLQEGVYLPYKTYLKAIL